MDFQDTYSPIVKISIVNTILSLALTHGWSVKQLEVKNAFLNGNIHETVYMRQSKRFQDKSILEDVCLLRKSLYRLKLSPRA